MSGSDEAKRDRWVGDGFREFDSRIDYFIKFAPRQNFGDYLPELFSNVLLTYPKIDADMFRLVGSVIDDRWIRKDLGRINGHLSGLIAFWCCGARSETAGLRPGTARHCRFFGVRGPLTRELLGLPANTVLGDPGLLAPLFHTPRISSRTAGKAICIPHTHDTKSDAELLAISGAEMVVHPEIDASESALRDLLDQIASAEFVLTASLHGAIIACAYGRPFAFWDNGHVDIPFKWQDFAGSIGIPALFAANLEEGRALYRDKMEPKLVLPPLAPILDICPFAVRPEILLRAYAWDGAEESDALLKAAGFLERQPSAHSDYVLALQRDSERNRAARARPGAYFKARSGLLLRRAKRRMLSIAGK